MDNRPIGVFDSGIGGLTVLEELEKILPEENYIYVGDTMNFPYGEKSKEQIIELSKKNIDYLVDKNVKLIIVACGTATSQSLKEMKELFNIPIIGIIEPTVNYIEKLNLKEIGVIATTGTIRSGAWEKTLKQKIPEIKVVNQACPLLASIVEDGEVKSKKSLDAIHSYMEIFKKNSINNIILGCTHYPIYDEIIRNEFEYKISLINTGKAIAKYIRLYIQTNKIENKGKKDKTKIIITKEEKNFDKKVKNILKSAKRIDITKFY